MGGNAFVEMYTVNAWVNDKAAALSIAMCIVTTQLLVDNYDMNVYNIHVRERKRGKERGGCL